MSLYPKIKSVFLFSKAFRRFESSLDQSFYTDARKYEFRTQYLNKGLKMRNFFIGLITIIVSMSAYAGPKEDAFQVLQKWIKAFSSSDVDTIVSLYAPDVMFFGTGSKALITKEADIRKYFEQALLNNRPRGAELGDYSGRVLSDNAVVFAGLDTLSGVKDGETTIAQGRWTFVMLKGQQGWKIAHFHRSAKPN